MPVQTRKHLRSASELSAREGEPLRPFGMPGYLEGCPVVSNRVRRARIRRAKLLRAVLAYPCPVNFCQAPPGYGCATRTGRPAARPHKARVLNRD